MGRRNSPGRVTINTEGVQREGQNFGTTEGVAREVTQNNEVQYEGWDEDEIGAIDTEAEEANAPAYHKGDYLKQVAQSLNRQTPETAEPAQQAPIQVADEAPADPNAGKRVFMPRVARETDGEQAAATAVYEGEKPQLDLEDTNQLANEAEWSEDELKKAAIAAYRQRPDFDRRSSYRYWDDWVKQNKGRIPKKLRNNYGPANLARKEMMSHWSMANPDQDWELAGMEGRAASWLRGNANHPLQDQYGDQFDTEWQAVMDRYANQGKKQARPGQPVVAQKPMFRDIMGNAIEYEKPDLGQQDFEKPDLGTQEFEKPDLGEPEYERPRNVDFLTNDAATAIDADTGEVLPNQHVPEKATSSYLDELPKEADLASPEKFADWLDKHRLDRDQTNSKILAKVRSLEPEFYEAQEFLQANQYLEPEMQEVVRRRLNDRDRKVTEGIVKEHELGFLHVEGEHLSRDPKTKRAFVQDEIDVEAARGQFANAMGLDPMNDRQLIDQYARCSFNYTPDTHGELFAETDEKGNRKGGKKPNTPIYKSTYIDSMDYMRGALEDPEIQDPLALTEDYRNGHRGFKDLRFPVAVYTQEMAAPLARKLNISVEEVIERGRLNTLNTYQAVTQFAYNNGDLQMLAAWEDHVRAMCKLSGYDPTTYGVPEVGGGSFGDEALANLIFEDVMGDGYPDALEAAKERTERAKESIASDRQKKGATLDKDGNIVLGKADSWSNSIVSIVSMIHIVGDLRLIITGAMEYGVGNLEARLASKMMIGYKKEYTVTEGLKEIGDSLPQKERVAALQMLFRAGSGFDFVQAFAAEGKPWTREEAQKFILQGSPKVPIEKVKKAQSWVADNVDKIQTGAFMANQDSKTFMASLMAELCVTNGLTAAQVEEGFRRNPDAFMSLIMQGNAGKQALVQMTNLYAARISPASEAVSNFLRSHGLTNAAVSTILGSPFITYGVRAFELFTPFSNTISWLITSKSKSDLKETQLGGIDEQGWKKALLFDCIKLGQNGLSCAVIAAAIGLCGGIEPPDDPEKYYLPWEWKINVPWSKEPIPFHQSWFMDDLFQWTAPLAMSLCYANQTGDFGGAADMFYNGFMDIYDTNKVVKCVSALLSIPTALRQIANGGVQMEDISDAMVDKCLGIIDYATKPMGLYQAQDWLHGNDLERNSAYWLNDEGQEQYRNSYVERKWAKVASENELLAFLGNAWSGFHGGSNRLFGYQNDGYSHDPDERLAQMAADVSYAGYLQDNPGLEDGDGAKAMYGEWLCNRLREYRDEAEAAEAGFAITASDAWIVKDYLYNRLDYNKDQEIELKKMHANGDFAGRSDAYWSLRDQWTSDDDECYQLLEMLAYEGLIYSDDIYNVERGSSMKNYGRLGEQVGAMLTGTLEKPERYNYGDRETWLSPLTSPETGNDYFREVFGQQTDTEGNYGDFRTESFRDDGTTAYQRHDVPNENNTIIKEFQDDFKAKKQELKDKEDAADTQASTTNVSNASSGRSWTGSYSYSSSSGGSSYNPKIYSIHGSNLSPNKPATIYAKSPYSTKTSYLSPNVSTKGSHGAYRRNEM